MTDPRSSPAPAVRTFISYAWSSPTHQTWVLQLATRLREDGVDVVLDKWDLKPGHDSYAFMEQMVTDKTVTKVIIVCNKEYADKADERSGGVGVETQILTPALYRMASQDKYAAILIERDVDDNAYVPAFFRGRIYIDFTGADREEAAYEELLRWIVDKPQFVKPSLGKFPDFITKPSAVTPATTSRLRRAEDAIRNGSENAVGLMRDFSDALQGDLPQHAPAKDTAVPWDETVLTAVEGLRPYIRQFQELTAAVCRYSRDGRTVDEVVRCLERLAPLMFRPESVNQWSDGDFDTFVIVVSEMFHSTFAIALREERFDVANELLTRSYYTKNSDDVRGPENNDFTVFGHKAKIFENRNARLKLNRLSVYADYLRDTYTNHSPNFQEMMQADFVLYLRSVKSATEHWRRWWPSSLLFAVRQFSPFEIFARAESKAYFSRIAPMLSASNLDEFTSFATQLQEQSAASRIWDYERLPVIRLANVENLGKRP